NLAQCSQASTVLLTTAKHRHVHRISRQGSVIGHSREHISSCADPALSLYELLLFPVAFTLL
ncbi:unnamed protein product, partial [Staurois parvus]